ncbi:MAG: DUF6340 family protein, partial [Bacteroidota bacterium]|nr:DUF6340 family protein [Bacteroidota bacterium]
MFTSCYSVKHFSSEILYPAENVFDKEITDVTLINRSYLPIEKRKQAGIFYKEGTYFRETEYNDSIVSDNALYSLAYRLNESLRFNIVRNDTITKLNNDKDVFLQPLLYDEVKDICDNHGAQAAVSLETFYSFDSLFVVYEGGYRLIRMTRLLSVYKFYFPHDGRLSTIDSKYYDDTLYWSVSGGLFDDLYDDMISRKDALYEVSYNSGIKFAERISPHWQSVNRLYYENSDEKMKLAAQYAELKEWKEAAKIWKEVTVSDKKISSALAKYNMAVASEMIGELD